MKIISRWYDIDNRELLTGVKINTTYGSNFTDFDGECKIYGKPISVDYVSYEYQYFKKDTIYMKKKIDITFGN